MLSIELRFPSERYHATPWDHHVNEGVVEWPPSPWRLARALIATRYLKATVEVNEEQLARIVDCLAEEAPRYVLPRATAGHTRHYMPLYKDKTTKVFDTFMHVEQGAAAFVSWANASLSDDDRQALDLLLNQMGYLGRAESWVEARLLRPEEVPPNPNVVPLDEYGEAVGEREELVPLLVPLPAAEFAAWRSCTFEEELQRVEAEKREKQRANGKDPRNVKLSPAEKKRLGGMIPRDLLSALYADTATLHKQGWSRVPGTRVVDFVRPRDLLDLAPRRRARMERAGPPIAARFAVASQVPPRLTDVVSMAERVRSALMSRSDGAAVFSGKTEHGRPALGHGHAFILPEANGAHGRITHVTLFASMGFDGVARRAMDGLQDVWGRGGHRIQLVLLGVGAPVNFAGTDVRAGQCPLFVSSATWVSRTPFVPTRHPKRTKTGRPKLDERGLQIGGAEHDLRRLIAAAGCPEPAHIEPLWSTKLGGKETRWLEFKTRRSRGHGARGTSTPVGFRIVFPRPVSGPLTFGYGAHFGLGLFVPEQG